MVWKPFIAMQDNYLIIIYWHVPVIDDSISFLKTDGNNIIISLFVGFQRPQELLRVQMGFWLLHCKNEYFIDNEIMLITSLRPGIFFTRSYIIFIIPLSVKNSHGI